jgi:hypothetical protein
VQDRLFIKSVFQCRDRISLVYFRDCIIYDVSLLFSLLESGGRYGRFKKHKKMREYVSLYCVPKKILDGPLLG